jgi:hypothetical protein
MLDEMTSIEASGTWELVEPPPRTKPIGLKWVYKTKKDAAGVITKHKARLVAKGYVQQQGIDFDEVFAPVAQLESVRLLLAHAAYEGWAVHHMDVKSAFLNKSTSSSPQVSFSGGMSTRCFTSSRRCTDCVKPHVLGTPSSMSHCSSSASRGAPPSIPARQR